MFCLNDTMHYFLCPGKTDMRKGINSLCGVVHDRMGVQYVDLLPFFCHERDAAPDGEPADEGAATYRGQHRHQGEFRFLC